MTEMHRACDGQRMMGRGATLYSGEASVIYTLYIPSALWCLSDALQVNFFSPPSLPPTPWPFLAALWHMELPSQGWDLSQSLHLSLSCGNAGSLTHCAGPGIKPEPQRFQDAANPVGPQQELCWNFHFTPIYQFSFQPYTLWSYTFLAHFIWYFSSLLFLYIFISIMYTFFSMIFIFILF